MFSSLATVCAYVCNKGSVIYYTDSYAQDTIFMSKSSFTIGGCCNLTKKEMYIKGQEICRDLYKNRIKNLNFKQEDVGKYFVRLSTF